ncbi:MAG: ribosome maturation factor RimM [Acidimicrobiales bacterium]
MTSPPRLEVGVIVKPHGLRGEVVVHLTTNRTERLDVGSALDATRGDPDQVVSRLVVERSRPHQGRWIVVFTGVGTLEEAESLRGLILKAEALDDPDTFWVHELLGCEVVGTNGGTLGRVEAVESNPASDLLVLDTGGLVPLVFVLDRQAGRLVVDVPEGLLE